MTDNPEFGIPNIGAPDQEGPLLFLPGGFNLAGTSIPYFMSSLRASDAARLISMPGDLPIDHDNPVVIAELFQRQVDEDHVEGLRSYLRSSSHLHFINAITVALLPLDETPSGPRVSHSFPTGIPVPLSQLPNYNPLPVGPVQLHKLPGNETHGYLSWQKGRVLPVVLDGQHRLLAIKRLLSESFAGQSSLANSKIPVLFLVLAPEAGFVAGDDQSVLSACRNVFIDLNQHPKRVSTSRLLLLNDRSLVSACTRAIIAESISRDDWGKSVEERVASTGRLPLAIVDWRSETAKFDGPNSAVTSLQALNASVARVLGVDDPDFEDLEAADSYVERVALRLLGADVSTAFIAEARNEIESCRVSESPFKLSERAVRQLAEGFRIRFGSRITTPLIEIAPYKALIDLLQVSEWVGTDFEPYFSLDEAGRTTLVGELELSDPAIGIQAETAAVKGQWPLAFQVVFQRGILDAIDSILTTAQIFDEDSWTLEKIVERINERVAPSLRIPASHESPFVGSGLRAEGIIDFRKTRVPSIAGFVVYLIISDDDLWAPGQLPSQEVATWLSGAFSQIQPGPPTSFFQAVCSRHGAAWRRGLQDVASARGLVDSDAIDNLGVQAFIKAVQHADNQSDVYS